MIKCKLVSVITNPIMIRVSSKPKGRAYPINIPMHFDPGKEKVIDETDALLIKALKDHETVVRWSEGKEQLLKDAGIPYRTEICKACRGDVRKLFYKTVEVYEDGK